MITLPPGVDCTTMYPWVSNSGLGSQFSTLWFVAVSTVTVTMMGMDGGVMSWNPAPVALLVE